MEGKALLEVKNLVIHYETDDAIVEAVNDISFEIHTGERLVWWAKRAPERPPRRWAYSG